MAPSSYEDMGGLSHLVEAATALTELVGRQQQGSISLQSSFSLPKKGSNETSSSGVISDDDELTTGKTTTKASASSNNNNNNNNKKNKDIFPQVLMKILDDQSLSEIVSWLPHGQSFVIIRPDLFVEQVVPKYLPEGGSTKYPSFTRKLNRWGFRQQTRGSDTGAFHHPYFLRDQRDLCLKMVCQKSRDRQVAAAQKQRTNSATPSSLPPKKRVVPSSTKMMNATPLVVPTSIQAPSPVVGPAAVSVDEDRSVSSLTSSNKSSNYGHNNINSSNNIGHPKIVSTSTQVNVGGATATVPSLMSVSSVPITTPLGLMQRISNDSAFVAATLRQRDSEEILRAAQAMLYESYMIALKHEQEALARQQQQQKS
jgi:hypothetical protein